MLERLAAEVHHVVFTMQNNAVFVLKIIGILWGIHLLNYFSQYALNNLGIRTRTMRGLFPGIFFSPWLHADFNHLFFNTIPLFTLASLVLLDEKLTFYQVSLTIITTSGLLTWLFGKRGIHIGASNLIMGYFGYLLARSYFHLTGTTIILAGICIYYFGGLILSIFPGTKKNVSWEGHLFGLLSGIFTAYYLHDILKRWSSLLH